MSETTPLLKTPIHRARTLQRMLGFEALYLKLECRNRTGTHKDRAAAAAVEEAVCLGAPGVTVGTCGNFGVALAHCASRVGLPCRVFVPIHYSNERVVEMVAEGCALEKVRGTYEHAVEESGRFATRSGFYDANPSGSGGVRALAAYSGIARELLQDLPDVPASVWVSAGNGTTLAGIHRGFEAIGLEPRVCGVASRGNSALIDSARCGRVVELDPADIVETAVNEPVVAWRAYHCAEALQALRSTRGWMYGATDQELVASAVLLSRAEGVESIPASAGALAGFQASAPDVLDRRATHVLVLTG
ncbi:MAG TPA: pyridoxal-phosphate dependent enzyme [Longimicrobiaceae bacterium]|nr:pyridoxal-phosphate dependent enzyme [Longimicrobiaceae bacterium]